MRRCLQGNQKTGSARIVFKGRRDILRAEEYESGFLRLKLES